MGNYYISVSSRSHAFLLERRIKDEGVFCELTFMPRELMAGLCNMGIRFSEKELGTISNIVRHAGLPNCIVYREVLNREGSGYEYLIQGI